MTQSETAIGGRMAFEATTSSELLKIARELSTQLRDLAGSNQAFVDKHGAENPLLATALGHQAVAISNVGIAVVKVIDAVSDHLISEARLRGQEDT